MIGVDFYGCFICGKILFLCIYWGTLLIDNSDWSTSNSL